MAAGQAHAAPVKRPRGEDDWRALRTLNFYRWLVGVGAGVAFASGAAFDLFEILWPALFAGASLTYLVFCLLATLAAYRRQPGLAAQVYALVAIDIAFVVALVLASGGVSDGLAVLLFAPIAGASVLVPPRMAALLAAAASLALLAEEGWRSLAYPGDTADWAQAGILGLLLFVTAGVASTLARRAHASAQLAAARKLEIEDLATLNERVIQQMAIGLLVVDERRIIRRVNRAAHDMLGLGPDAIGGSLQARMPALAWELQAWLVAPHLAVEPFDAGRHSFIPHFTRLGEGTTAPVLIFLEDARRVSEAAQQIKLAALGRLTAGIAHEIRNPLSAISHAGQLLEESDKLGADERRLLAILHRHTQRIDGVIESVLGLSRRGKALPARLDLGAWLAQAVTDYRQAHRQPPELRLEVPRKALYIHADPSQLQQVFTNLVDNAERHASQPGQALRVTVSAGTGAGGEPFFDVADNGPGIAAKVAAHLMEPFFTTEATGTGLGLYLARELCEVNFAHIGLLRREGGATFRVTFASADAVAAVGAPRAGEHAA